MATYALSETATQALCKRARTAWHYSQPGQYRSRPDIVEQRARIGDWEGDTMIGRNHERMLVTLAERKSRYILAGQLPAKHAEGVTEKINHLLRPHKHKCHTVTFDNGKEFAGHDTIASGLETDIYFAHPYHSWERGLNENSNG